jgi:hypothetical protein
MIIALCIIGWFVVGGMSSYIVHKKYQQELTIGWLIAWSAIGVASSIGCLIYILYMSGVFDIKVVKGK